MTSYKDWIVIGISGVTCGGKTTLAKRLQDTMAPVSVFHQDKYFYPDDSPKHVKCDGIDHNNYDILSSLDMDGMYKDVLATLEGDKTRAHASHDDAEGRLNVGRNILILEGFTLLNYKPLFDLCTLRYYFTLTYDECVRRRQSRVYDPPDVPGYFEECVWPEHERYKAELLDSRVVSFIDGSVGNDQLYEKVVSDVRSLVESKSCTIN